MTTTESIERRRAAHHKALEQIALWVNFNTDGKVLWRKLNRIEREVYRACEAYSNDSNFGLDKREAARKKAKAGLLAAFGGTIPQGVFINGDPRGHMLKLDCDVRRIPDGLERDWGGNGILAATIEAEDHKEGVYFDGYDYMKGCKP